MWTLKRDPHELLAVADYMGVTLDVLMGAGTGDPYSHYEVLGQRTREQCDLMIGAADLWWSGMSGAGA